MRSESDVPFEDNPFTIPVADRVKRLPPYLFGKINKLKYQKRVAGVDVIDLGMGNPTDPPDPLITRKTRRGLERSPQPPLFGVGRPRQPPPGSGGPVFQAVRRAAGAFERNHRLHRLERRFQPSCAWP